MAAGVLTCGSYDKASCLFAERILNKLLKLIMSCNKARRLTIVATGEDTCGCRLQALNTLASNGLTIACSIKVKHPTGNFKPEYIIPQLLLQYISKNDKIDGIKFLSTKVDYSKLHNVEAYNYVFPVKTIEKKGFCSILSDLFHSTEPTSLELEEIIYNPTTHPMVIDGGTPTNTRQIELVEGQKSYYSTTSFGKIETSLKIRSVGKV